MYENGELQKVVPKDWANVSTNAKILMSAEDLENSEYLFTLTLDSSGTKHLNMLYQSKLENYD